MQKKHVKTVRARVLLFSSAIPRLYSQISKFEQCYFGVEVVSPSVDELYSSERARACVCVCVYTEWDCLFFIKIRLVYNLALLIAKGSEFYDIIPFINLYSHMLRMTSWYEEEGSAMKKRNQI